VRLILAACAMLLALSAVRADTDLSLREEGVLYFEDTTPNRIIAPVKKPTTLYLRRDFQDALALLVPGQSLELIGMAPEGYMVKGTYRNNAVTGWITAADLPPGVDPKVITDAKAAQARANQMAPAIREHRIVRGMTPDEVRQSLGDPEQTSTRSDDTGSTQSWTYTQYTSVWKTSYQPGYYGGQGIATTYLAKVPVGTTTISFVNGLVSAIEVHKTNPNSPSVQNN
jgi:hypothetical protein